MLRFLSWRRSFTLLNGTHSPPLDQFGPSTFYFTYTSKNCNHVPIKCLTFFSDLLCDQLVYPPYLIHSSMELKRPIQNCLEVVIKHTWLYESSIFILYANNLSWRDAMFKCILLFNLLVTSASSREHCW